MKETPNHYEILLAGLLHDIGKFMQRAHLSEDSLSEVSKKLESSICPAYKGRYSHRHVLFTNEFCDKYLKCLPKNIRAEVLTSLAIYHHLPTEDSIWQKLITEADGLSSAEREFDEEYSDSDPTSFRKVRLKSVLAEVEIKEEPTAGKQDWVHHLDELSPVKAFPVPIDSDSLRPKKGEFLTEAYKALWDRFISAWQENKIQDCWQFTNRALSILERFTWCIPSATNVDPDISLFDHLKTTAAIAACLFMSEDKDRPFILVCAEFGGIQRYIFDISAGVGGLAKRLRARSFFVDLAGDSVAYHILRKIDLPLTNCILASGGHFYLLLPNTEKTTRVIDTVREEVDSWAIEETKGQVSLNLAFVRAISKEELKDFGLCLARVNDVLRQQKNMPLSAGLKRDNKWNEGAFLLNPLIEGDKELCKSCHKAAARSPKTVDEEEIEICDPCWNDSKVGEKLPKNSLVAFYNDPGIGRKLPFGSFKLFSQPDAIKDRPYLVLSLDGYISAPSEVPIVGFFEARHVPQDENRVLEFEKIAELAKGANKLAYLKADVDNLGYIFQAGLKRELGHKPSISRISTLSRSLDLFFSGYFEHLLRIEFYKIYTIYSGGDDLLCLGPWDHILEFARVLRKKFYEYTCNNNSWTMSAGIALVNDSTPVNIATDFANELLKVAKEILAEGVVPLHHDASKSSNDPSKKPTKDRISVFGTSIPWDSYEQILNRARWLLGLVEDKTLNIAKVRRLMKYSDLYRRFQQTGRTSYLEYLPLLVYDLRRNWGSQKKELKPREKEAISWAAELRNPPPNPEMEALRFITEYALTGIRTMEENENKEEVNNG
ncbi:MAG: type III-A CRISPR-associated protein Cas10/Csm1 [Candidatus Bathyarchaeia archaeon]